MCFPLGAEASTPVFPVLGQNSAPDVRLIPPLASFFGVSIDELFDYNVWENEQTVDEICRRAYARRYNDPAGAEAAWWKCFESWQSITRIAVMKKKVLCASVYLRGC